MSFRRSINRRRAAVRLLLAMAAVVAIASTFKRMERPQKIEGYDEVHTVELTADNQFLVLDYAQ